MRINMQKKIISGVLLFYATTLYNILVNAPIAHRTSHCCNIKTISFNMLTFCL